MLQCNSIYLYKDCRGVMSYNVEIVVPPVTNRTQENHS
jgi:hypothetical protein